jgi:hypothetical protein
VPMTTIASGASPGPIIIFTKPLSITAGKANKRNMRVTNYAKRVSFAGTVCIAGGMKTGTAGIPSTTGTIATTIMTVITIAITHRAKSGTHILS